MHEYSGLDVQYPNIYEYPSVPLKLIGWQGSQVTEHAQALVGTVNTASLNLTAGQVGSRMFMFVYLMIF